MKCQGVFRLKPEAPPLAVLDASVFLKAAMLSLFTIAVVRTAWMCDDAYITLRTVDNFVSGFGPRWNVAERVQTYTHPLWMFVLALPYYVTREAYFTPLVVSMLASLAAMWLLVTRIAVSSATAIIGASVLIFSRAFVEFSTSGLENPLTHLLLAIFFVLYWHPERAHRLTHLWIVVSLIMVNRLDAGLLVLPAMLVRTYQVGWRPGVKAVAIGVVPLVTWELFSIIYYGFPFPNTAYAKLSNGVPPGELASQGIAFLLNSAANDPLTLLAMGTFVSVALASYPRVSWPLALGVVLYVVYVVRVGGDFMSGRFLTAPLFSAVALFARLQVPWTSSFTAVVTAAIFGLGVFATVRPPLANRDGLVNPPRAPASSRASAINGRSTIGTPACSDGRGRCPFRIICGKPRAGKPACTRELSRREPLACLATSGGPEYMSSISLHWATLFWHVCRLGGGGGSATIDGASQGATLRRFKPDAMSSEILTWR